MDLKETAAAAKAEGMTYGEYVTKYGPQVDVKIPAGLETQKEKTPPKPPEPAPQEEPEGVERTCAQCGKTFRVLTEKSRKKYCSILCQHQAQYDRAKKGKTKAKAGKAPAPEKRPVTFGDILDLLERGSIEVTVHELQSDGNITGEANCKLWAPMEGMIVKGISPVEGGLDVWIMEESNEDL